MRDAHAGGQSRGGFMAFHIYPGVTGYQKKCVSRGAMESKNIRGNKGFSQRLCEPAKSGGAKSAHSEEKK